MDIFLKEAIGQHLRSADALEDAGQFREALLVWRALVALHPTAQFWMRMAECAGNIGEFEEAEKGFQAAIRIDPRFTPALLGIAYLYLKHLQNLESAQAYAQSALAVEENEIGLVYLGVILRERGDVAGAKLCLQRCIEKYPEYEEAYYNLGMLTEKSDAEAAIALYQCAIELDPAYADVHRRLGGVLLATGEHGLARAHLRRAVELNERDCVAHLDLARAEWLLGYSFGEVTREFRRALALQNDSESISRYASFCDERGWTARADVLFRRAIHRDPRESFLLKRYGVFLLDHNRLDDAARYLRRAYRADASQDSRALLRRVKARQGRLKGRS